LHLLLKISFCSFGDTQNPQEEKFLRIQYKKIKHLQSRCSHCKGDFLIWGFPLNRKWFIIKKLNHLRIYG